MKAKMYAHSSIYKLKQELEHIKAQIQQLQSRDADVSVELLNSAREKQSLCAIAHYNLGSQQEFLKEYPKALESYRQALILEKTKNDFQGLKAVAPSPLINEFQKSYKDVQRKMAWKQQQNSGSMSGASFRMKKTFSGLNKQYVDQLTGTVSQSYGNYASKSSAISMSQAYRGLQEKASLTKMSSKASIQQQQAIGQVNQHYQSPKTRQRPQSAKNPPLQFARAGEPAAHEVLADILGDDIINIQNPMIQEQDDIDQDCNVYANLPQESQVNHQPKARKIRPVSSYVKKSQENMSNLINQPRPAASKPDQFYLSSSIQNLNMASEETSNVDTASNFPKVNPKLSMPRSTFMQSRTGRSSVTGGTVQNKPLSHYETADGFRMNNNDDGSMHQMLQRPARDYAKVKLRGGDLGSQASNITTTRNAAQTVAMSKQQRPSSSYTMASRASKLQSTKGGSFKSLANPKPPSIPKPAPRLGQARTLGHFKAPTVKTQHLRPKRTSSNNRDLALPPTEGDRLINAIDKGYQFLQSQDSLSNRPAGQGDKQARLYGAYEQEMVKQSEYSKNNMKMAQDLENFSKSQRRLLQSIKQKEKPNNSKAIIKSRPQTAKSKQVAAEERIGDIEKIEEHSVSEEKSPRDYEKEIMEQLKIESVPYQQRYSLSRSRSKSKSQNREQRKPTKNRPRSAYPQQEVSLSNMAQGRISNTQLKKPKAGNPRIQSAGARRPGANIQNEDIESPYVDRSRRIRPDNRPRKLLQESSGKALDLIDEDESNGDTQMIYSGTIRSGSKHNSSLERGNEPASMNRQTQESQMNLQERQQQRAKPVEDGGLNMFSNHGSSLALLERALPADPELAGRGERETKEYNKSLANTADFHSAVQSPVASKSSPNKSKRGPSLDQDQREQALGNDKFQESPAKAQKKAEATSLARGKPKAKAQTSQNAPSLKAASVPKAKPTKVKPGRKSQDFSKTFESVKTNSKTDLGDKQIQGYHTQQQQEDRSMKQKSIKNTRTSKAGSEIGSRKSGKAKTKSIKSIGGPEANNQNQVLGSSLPNHQGVQENADSKLHAPTDGVEEIEAEEEVERPETASFERSRNQEVALQDSPSRSRSPVGQKRQSQTVDEQRKERHFGQPTKSLGLQHTTGAEHLKQLIGGQEDDHRSAICRTASDQVLLAPNNFENQAKDQESAPTPGGATTQLANYNFKLEKSADKSTSSLRAQLAKGKTLADCIQVSNNGTSGYKEGESQFDEEYYKQYQQEQVREAELEARRQAVLAQHEQQEDDKLRLASQDRQFDASYKQYVRFKLHQEILERFYDPVEDLKAKKRAEAAEKAEQEKQQEELQAQQEVLKAKMRKQTLLEVEKKVNDLDKKQQESQQSLHQSVVGDERRLTDEDEPEAVRKMRADGTLAEIFVGRNKFIKIPINELDDEKMERDRAGAISFKYGLSRMQLDQCPYNSKHFGLCQLVFVIIPASHILQVLVFKAEESEEGTLLNLKVNREINLLSFGIAKPVHYEDKPANLYADKEVEKIRSQYEKAEKKIQFDAALKIISVIRMLKANCTGDVYADFYQFGEPGSTDGEVVGHDRDFAVHVQSLLQLEQEINEKLIQRIQFKYFQSKAFQQFNLRFAEELAQSSATKSPRAPMAALVLIQRAVRRMIKLKHQREANRLRARIIEESLKYTRFATFQQKFLFTACAGGVFKKANAFIRVNLCVTGDHSSIQVEGYDLNPVRKLKYQVATQTMDVKKEVFEQIQKDTEYLQENLEVGVDKQDPSVLKFDLDALAQPDLQLKMAERAKKLLQKTQGAASVEDAQRSDERESLTKDRTDNVATDGGPGTNTGDQGVTAARGQASQQRQVQFQREDQRQPSSSVRSPESRGDADAEWRRRQHSAEQRHRILRKTIGLGSDQAMRAARAKIEGSASKYQSVFDDRRRLLLQREPYEPLETVHKDDNMWAYEVKTPYDYAVLKIQLFWRRRQFRGKMEVAIAEGGRFSRSCKTTKMLDKVAEVELELGILRQARGQAQAAQEQAGKTKLDMIRHIQRRWRLQRLARRARERLSSWVHIEASEGRSALFHGIREFIEGPLDITPSNYSIAVTKEPTLPGSKLLEPIPLLLFHLEMSLNNKPEKEDQHYTIKHDITGNEVERELLAKSQASYFRSLVEERLVFVPFQARRLRERYSHIRKMQNAEEPVFRLARFNPFSSGTREPEKEPALGEYKILSLDEHRQRLEAQAQEQVHHGAALQPQVVQLPNPYDSSTRPAEQPKAAATGPELHLDLSEVSHNPPHPIAQHTAGLQNEAQANIIIEKENIEQ